MKKVISISALLAVLILSSCRKDPINMVGIIDPPPSIETISLSGQWQKAYYKGELIAYEKKNKLNLFLGDIIIPNEELSAKPQKKGELIMGTGITGTTYLWLNKTMNYVIDSNTTDIKKQWIIMAMKNWANSTGFRFVDVSKNSNKGDYVYIIYGTIGNNSFVGRTGGKQIINLKNDGVGVIVHELGHALGLYHEQTRSDRDRYIIVNWNNIKPEWRPQFIRYACADNIRVNDPNTRFDFKSIMLYASISSTAINVSLPVMTKKNGDIWGDNVYYGTNAPSATDANWVKIRYNISN